MSALWRIIGYAWVRIALFLALAGLLIAGLSTFVLMRPVPLREDDPSALSWQVLRNASYPSEFPRSKIARLADGVYEEEYVPGAATKLVIRLAEIGAFGLLDDDEAVDAAVVLISSPGGSGVFIHLVAVRNAEGEAIPLAATLLGDRVAVRALSILPGGVTVKLRVRDATDPFAVLTREVERRYSIQGDQLVLEEEATLPTPRSAPQDLFVHDPQRIELAPSTSPQNVEGTLQPGQIADYVIHGS